MNRSRNIIIVVIIVVVLGGAALAFGLMSKSDNKPTTDMGNMDMSNSQSSSSSDSSASSTPVATSSVTIKDFAFSPAAITVKVGTKVTWTNQDSTQHTVTGDTSDGPKSELLSQGQSYSFTFTKAGTYNYICSVHPYMKAKVVVTE